MKTFLLFLFIFLFRLALSFVNFNNDVLNHEVWMNSVHESGWLGLYSRDQSPWAEVNYPPFTLYSFKLGYDLHKLVPAAWDSPKVEAVFYKLPSLLADLGIAVLLYFLAPFTRKWRLGLSMLFLFNPALFYNSVFWGQVESWALFWCVLTGFFLVNKRGELAIISFVIAMLCKQNSIVLAPLVAFALILEKPSLSKIIAATSFSLGLVFLSYLPLLGSGATLVGISQNYLTSLAGQAHQHLGSVNALNFWYLLGFNKEGDSGIRVYSLIFTVVITLYSLWYYFKNRVNLYKAFFTSSAILYIGIFLFTTRMHERHLYMGIAFMTFVLPYFQNYFWYALISLLSFYNQWIVWAEFMAVAPLRESLWILWNKVLSLVSVIAGAQFVRAVSHKAKSKT